jgi:hypothetical protein
MSSKVQLCNLALARLGAARITSLSDNTNEAKLCNLMFDDIAEEVMSEGAWSSTVSRASLALTANTPAYGYTYEFQLPTDPFCLRVLEINDLTSGDYDYRIEGDKLLANINTMKIRYIGRITDTQSYDPMLKRAVVSRLAAELAYPITGNLQTSKAMQELYQFHIADGLAVDGTQGSVEDVFRSDDVDVR